MQTAIAPQRKERYKFWLNTTTLGLYSTKRRSSSDCWFIRNSAMFVQLMVRNPLEKLTYSYAY